MVGASILVVALATVTVLRWLRQPTSTEATRPSAIIEAPSTATSRAPSDTFRTPPPIPIVHLSDPLAFLSTAGADSLDMLPGIGPVLAARLIAARERHGAFRSWDDVDRVRGMGPKTIERLQALASH
ncbi:MAG TPA: helix-hairpin-helix domain-containing protein [Candidatus Krumholzibacteria bacterium]|nr:helix-hairpin-helix domain-containing protein [Candidatus Krumholzibacteria bacterium]